MAGMYNKLKLLDGSDTSRLSKENREREAMDSEVVERQFEERPGTPPLAELKQSDAAGRANRRAVPPRELYRESPDKGHRSPPSPNPDRARREPVMTPIMQRMRKIERQYRTMRTGFIALLIVLGFTAIDQFSKEGISAGKTLIKSEELKLVDISGRPRVFLRMFSDVPVMQVLDANGNPRLSLGLRFDDTPFIDLSDSSGMTRVTFQVTGNGEPALHMFDGRGESTFSIN